MQSCQTSLAVTIRTSSRPGCGERRTGSSMAVMGSRKLGLRRLLYQQRRRRQLMRQWTWWKAMRDHHRPQLLNAPRARPNREGAPSPRRTAIAATTTTAEAIIEMEAASGIDNSNMMPQDARLASYSTRQYHPLAGGKTMEEGAAGEARTGIVPGWPWTTNSYLRQPLRYTASSGYADLRPRMQHRLLRAPESSLLAR